MSAAFTATRRKLSVEAFHDLAKAGHLTEDDRVELIDGEIIEMAPIGGPHLNIVNRLTRFFVLALGERGVVSPQNPVALPRYSDPRLFNRRCSRLTVAPRDPRERKTIGPRSQASMRAGSIAVTMSFG
jgi:Uma2 family endonuclease